MVHLPESKFPIVKTESTFKNIWGKLCRLFPFLWPKQSVILQIQVVLCLLAIVAGRVVNLYVPIYSKLIVDSLSLDPAAFRWDYAVTYCFLKFLEGGNGNMGALSTIREFLWIRIQQFTAIKIQVELLKHLHSLPLRWHLNRKTGQVVKVMDRGSDSIDNLLSYILFLVSPTIIDIIIAILYLISQFNIWFGLIVFVTMSLYILATIGIIEWRTKYHRRMNEAENEQKAQAVDSLLNYETVKYFGMEHYECSAYRDVIQDFQRQEWLASVSLNLLYIVQNIIICGGLLAGSLLCIRMVSFKEGLTVGDYVLFSSYIIQLYVPLNSFGSYYRSIQKYFVDMENMFELFNETSEVKELSNAPDLVVKKGTVEFRNVDFGYTPERIVLKDVSFTVPTGKTIALVGPSGGGKSTIVRLLFRFYDVNKGQITIDGQDIRDVSAKSLWASLGVVPQDVVLFNNSLLYNIEYGRKGASTSEVLDAAKSADIHNRILSFSNAYETQVGERGLRLSGGEKQRIAIARTLLKDPAIVLLDEATSALDTNTERNIQESLMKVCANRTTLIIAHRLSTIIHADEILVLKDGTIVERGRHEDLISQQGVYAKMWQQQLENSIVRRKVSKESIPKEENLDNLSRSSSHNRRRRSWHGMSYKKHSHDY